MNLLLCIGGSLVIDTRERLRYNVVTKTFPVFKLSQDVPANNQFCQKMLANWGEKPSNGIAQVFV
jgi:hypothetical protein